MAAELSWLCCCPPEKDLGLGSLGFIRITQAYIAAPLALCTAVRQFVTYKNIHISIFIYMCVSLSLSLSLSRGAGGKM